MICSICHGLVEEAVFVHVACSCHKHLRCAMAFVESTAARAGARMLKPRYAFRAPDRSQTDDPLEYALRVHWRIMPWTVICIVATLRMFELVASHFRGISQAFIAVGSTPRSSAFSLFYHLAP